MGFNFKDYPQAEKYYKEAISLPIFPSLKEEDQIKIVGILNKPLGYQNLF